MLKSHRWHSSVGKLQKTALNSDINVTPLVDVCLVLLIIFMVVTPMLQKGVPVNLPVTEDPDKTPDTDKQLQISSRRTARSTSDRRWSARSSSSRRSRTFTAGLPIARSP